MKRIDIAYGANSYSVGGRDLDELRAQIMASVEGAAPPFWLEVNHGEGQPRPTSLLISPATQLALTPIPGDDELL
ncbi:hypothetical protein NQ166_03215 [Microbacterium sp. zg.Y1090]|uniref:hypothetical protein n=1 Tax=Microbacterium TaxID=33882 RepID=UPI00214BED28|nr:MULTISPECIES: hypothetical protein [unclassified Microbacterium]MCR2812361.1 hypothetical protein [Microbacterium sp. zg.Y1084]MCR2817838.1 hypothetical protein [Microbacterium sp. zg.Y1090]MDL5485518.1 hypothetical protein [Microbacterium sp. zg-Y1211]WIM28690.1 hypothetical protein QNO26_02000 [Microbacterium sp. zg-Y1090]